MPLKTPQFWHKRLSMLSILIIPFSWLYRICHKINMMRQGTPYKSSIPVICVGNAIAGGSGKTPTVLALLKIIQGQGLAQNPVILTRGYKGQQQGAITVDLATHTANDVGDEALMLATHSPVIVAKNRAEGARLAEQKDFDLIIMDDGLQNKHLYKNISFLVVDRQIDFGNNRVLPAGPLREPLKTVLDKIDGIICIGRAFHSDLPVFEAAIDVTQKPSSSKKYIAFAGLGYPEKFKNTLLDLGIDLVGWHDFADHHDYTNQELEDLYDQALNNDAQLITTEKDYKRLSKDWQEKIDYLPIELKFKDEESIATFLKNRLTP